MGEGGWLVAWGAVKNVFHVLDGVGGSPHTLIHLYNAGGTRALTHSATQTHKSRLAGNHHPPKANTFQYESLPLSSHRCHFLYQQKKVASPDWNPLFFLKIIFQIATLDIFFFFNLNSTLISPHWQYLHILCAESLLDSKKDDFKA